MPSLYPTYTLYGLIYDIVNTTEANGKHGTNKTPISHRTLAYSKFAKSRIRASRVGPPKIA